MIETTLKQIRERLAGSTKLSESRRRELTELLEQLESEIRELDRSNPDHARSIAGYTEMSAHEATRDDKQEDLLEDALKALRTSVRGFEAAHPQLSAVVNRIATTLSNLGI